MQLKCTQLGNHWLNARGHWDSGTDTLTSLPSEEYSKPMLMTSLPWISVDLCVYGSRDTHTLELILKLQHINSTLHPLLQCDFARSLQDLQSKGLQKGRYRMAWIINQILSKALSWRVDFLKKSEICSALSLHPLLRNRLTRHSDECKICAKHLFYRQIKYSLSDKFMIDDQSSD